MPLPGLLRPPETLCGNAGHRRLWVTLFCNAEAQEKLESFPSRRSELDPAPLPGARSQCRLLRCKHEASRSRGGVWLRAVPLVLNGSLCL